MQDAPTQIVVVGAGHWRGEGMALVEAVDASAERGHMTAPRDKLGRPIVVVTGMGIMTSLGAGKADNWAKLVAGESGIRTITRFSVDGPKTTMAGTVDFVSVDPFSSTGLSERMAELVTEEALEQSGIGAEGDFRPPLPRRRRRSKWNGRSAASSAERSARPTSTTTISCASPAAASSPPTITASCSARSRLTSPRPSAPRARRSRCRRPAPRARPRSSSASRRSAAGRPMRRCALRQTGR